MYSFLTATLSPLLILLIKFRVKKSQEDRFRYRERFGITCEKRPDGKVIWIHAASVGESKAALTWISQQNSDNDVTYVFTTVTLTGRDTVFSEKHKNIIHQFSPLDNMKWVNRFINHWKPQSLILVESEIWPNWIEACKKNKIKMHIRNARISTRSIKKWKKFPKISNYIFSSFETIEAQSNEMIDFFKSISCKNVTYVQNLKLSSEKLFIDDKKFDKIKSQVGSRPLWIASSTHKGEEEELIKIHEKLVKKFPDILLIIIPRHPNRTEEVEKILKDKNLKFSVRSRNENIENTHAIYIADTLGELGVFYSLSNISFIGGSLVDVGGHNPIEAKQLNCEVVCGPYIHNFKEIYSDLSIAPCNNALEVYERLLKHFNYLNTR